MANEISNKVSSKWGLLYFVRYLSCSNSLTNRGISLKQHSFAVAFYTLCLSYIKWTSDYVFPCCYSLVFAFEHTSKVIFALTAWSLFLPRHHCWILKNSSAFSQFGRRTWLTQARFCKTLNKCISILISETFWRNMFEHSLLLAVAGWLSVGEKKQFID